MFGLVGRYIPVSKLEQGLLAGLLLTFFGSIVLRPDWGWFNNADTYKLIWVVGLGGLMVFASMFCGHSQGRQRFAFLLLLPLLAQLPGMLIHQGEMNRNVTYEMGVWLGAFFWVYAFLGLKDILRASQILMAVLAAFLFMMLGVFALETLETHGAPQSFFGNQNQASNFVILTLPIVLAYGYAQKNKYLRWGSVLLALAWLTYMAVFVQTRAAMAAIMGGAYVGMALYAYMYGWRKRLSIFIVLPLILIGLVYWAYTHYWELGGVGGRYINLLSPTEWYLRTRPWEVMIYAWGQSPWLGYGPGASWSLINAYGYAVPELSIITTMGGDYVHSHSELTESLVEGGILGTLVYYCMWIGAMMFSLSLATRKDAGHEIKIVATGIFIGLLAYQLHGLVDVSIRSPENRLAGFVVLALLLGFFGKKAEEIGSKQSKQLWEVVAVALAFFAAYACAYYESGYQRSVVEMRQAASNRDSQKVNDLLANADYPPTLYTGLNYHLFGDQNADQVEAALSKMHREIPSYLESDFLAVYGYLLTKSGGVPNKGELEKRINKSREGDRYFGPSLQFYTQYMAQTKNYSGFLGGLSDLLFAIGVQSRAFPELSRDRVNVIVDKGSPGILFAWNPPGLKGFYAVLSPDVADFMLLSAQESKSLSEYNAYLGDLRASKKIVIRVDREPYPDFLNALRRASMEFLNRVGQYTAPPIITYGG